jgi:hypothetical protein
MAARTRFCGKASAVGIFLFVVSLPIFSAPSFLIKFSFLSRFLFLFLLGRCTTSRAHRAGTRHMHFLRIWSLGICPRYHDCVLICFLWGVMGSSSLYPSLILLFCSIVPFLIFSPYFSFSLSLFCLVNVAGGRCRRTTARSRFRMAQATRSTAAATDPRLSSEKVKGGLFENKNVPSLRSCCVITGKPWWLINGGMRGATRAGSSADSFTLFRPIAQ